MRVSRGKGIRKGGRDRHKSKTNTVAKAAFWQGGRNGENTALIVKENNWVK